MPPRRKQKKAAATMDQSDITTKLDIIMKKLEDLDAVKEAVSQLQHDRASHTVNDDNLDGEVHSHHVNAQTARMPTLKLEFPRFDGTDPISWINEAERFLKFHQIPPAQRVTIASFYLEKEARQWYYWLEQYYGDGVPWRLFTESLISRFGPTKYDDFSIALKNLKQTGPLREYQMEFERLTSRLTNIPSENLLSFFIGGLRDDVQLDVQSKEPRDLFHAISLARLFEEKLSRARRATRFNWNRGTPPGNPPQVGTSSKPINPNFKKLTIEEMKARREKGLCYNCDERFSPNHKCKAQQFFLIEGEALATEETHESDEEEERTTTEDDQDNIPTSVEPEISFHALTGSAAPQTMRVQGTIKHYPIVVLIDTGSTHNFINTKLAQRLGCRIQTGSELPVTVANGEILRSHGMCSNLLFKIQNSEFTTDVHLLDFGGCDMVLGAHWLRTLGPILWDFTNLWMQFRCKGADITFKGIKTSLPQIIKPANARKAIRSGASCSLLFMCNAVESIEEEPTDPTLQSLLHQFADVFTEPQGLPPARSHDHCIVLESGSRPVNVRPYRYPHFQKGEIERQVTDMLASAELAFETLKKAMVSTPVLALPDFSQQFVIECDASGRAIGAVLMQGRRPIAFISKVLPIRSKGISTYEKEMEAIVFAVTKWRPYLVGRKFLIRTDHRSIKYMDAQRASTPAQQRWLSKLMGYTYEIMYKTGAENRVADALSRYTTEASLAAISTPIHHWVDCIMEECRNNPYLLDLQSKIKANPTAFPHYRIDNLQLFYKGRLVLDPNSSHKIVILQRYHDSAEGGHAGYLKTIKRARQNFWWKGLKKDVKRYVASCDICQRSKSESIASPGLLQPLPIPSKVWTDISMDFIDGLPSSNGKTVVFVVVDRLSKYAHFIPLSHPYTAAQVALAFVDHVFKLHGMPSSIVSDRDAVFTSGFWRELFRLQALPPLRDKTSAMTDLHWPKMTVGPVEDTQMVCQYSHMTSSRGFWARQHPLDYSTPVLMAQIIIIFVATRTTYAVLKPLGQNLMVAQILVICVHLQGGVILGPSFLGSSPTCMKRLFLPERRLVLQTIADFGYMLHLFLVGVQVDTSIVKRGGRNAMIIGISCSLGPYVVALPVFFVVKNFLTVDTKTLIAIPYVVGTCSLSSFPVITTFLSDLKILNSEVGRLASSSSMVSDMFIWTTVTSIISLRFAEHDLQLISVWSILSVAAYNLTLLFVIRPLALWVVRQTPEGKPVKEIYIFSSLLVILGCGFCAEIIGQHFAMGAYLLGLAIPDGPPLGAALVHKIDTIVSGLFMPVFFAIIGMKTNLVPMATDDSTNSVLVPLLVVFFSYIGKFTGTILPSLYCKVPFRDAFSLSLVMSYKGITEMGFYCLFKDLKVGLIRPLVMILYDPSRRYKAYKRRTILHAKQYSEFCILACIHSHDNVPTIIKLLELSNPNRASPICVSVLHLRELTARVSAILIQGNSKLSGNSIPIVNAFEYYAQHNQGHVTVQHFTAISPYASMHDDICTLALDQRTSIVIVPFHKQWSFNGLQVESSFSAIRTVNCNVLDKAPCSVGILVDRENIGAGSRCVLASQSLYRIALLFLGGADDREALAYARRMAEHPSTSIAVLQFTVSCDIDRYDSELDRELMRDFRVKNMENERIVCKDEVVSDGMGITRAVLSMGNEFDLFIVGRHHGSQSPLISGLTEWSEFPELGIIGDMLASSDFKSSVLVVQQQPHGDGSPSSPNHPVARGRGTTSEVFHDSSEDEGDKDTYLVQQEAVVVVFVVAAPPSFKGCQFGATPKLQRLQKTFATIPDLQGLPMTFTAIPKLQGLPITLTLHSRVAKDFEKKKNKD
ncbi:hypothetical protein HHK36_016090 [Tetracentron sinense]|uniref:Integrase catalytic domain-containing protein n=1 Tax=Tetracentron sinense TaxID=13715 RepID=A0A835DB66_TETSI|nr:hypothetical protein HHK36_016090 [Tetracentron sinense]